MLNIEVWKSIEGYDYEVSSLGRVRNSKGRILKPWIINSGYQMLSLFKEKVRTKFLVHRLVANAFYGLTAIEVVNHLDSNRLNNNADNLEVTTTAGNLQHARDAGRMPYNNPTRGLKLPPRGTTGKVSSYYNVCWVSSRQRWLVRVQYNSKVYAQRRFKCEVQAAQYRDSVVKEHGLPLKLNFD